MASNNQAQQPLKPTSSGTTPTPFGDRGGSQPSLTSEAGKGVTPPPKTK